MYTAPGKAQHCAEWPASCETFLCSQQLFMDPKTVVTENYSRVQQQQWQKKRSSDFAETVQGSPQVINEHLAINDTEIYDMSSHVEDRKKHRRILTIYFFIQVL